MASIGFWAIAAACALSYLATPLKRGASWVRPLRGRGRKK